MADLAGEIIRRLRLSERPLVANVSNRHLHLTAEAVAGLFGSGATLTKARALIPPGQFATAETVTLVGPKGQIAGVRIVGPTRPYNQAEVSRTDAFALGLNPPVRESGDLKGSAPIKIVGPKGTLDLAEGCILALRHIHLHPKEAESLGLKDKSFVRVACEGERAVIFERVLCRVREDMRLECHVDTDEANAAGLKNGTQVRIV